MNTAWQRYVETASGLTKVTKQAAERTIQGLVKQGEVAADRAERAVDELLKRSEMNRQAVSKLVAEEVERAVGRLGLVRRRDLERLEDRIDTLQRASGTATATDAPATAGGTGPAAAAETSPPDKKVQPTRASRAPAAKKAAPKRTAAAKKSPPRKATGNAPDRAGDATDRPAATDQTDAAANEESSR